MRIIKGDPCSHSVLRHIAGEILNIDASALVFERGQLVADPTLGYPRTVIGPREYIHRSPRGMIYIHDNIDTEMFIPLLLSVIVDMENQLAVTHPDIHKRIFSAALCNRAPMAGLRAEFSSRSTVPYNPRARKDAPSSHRVIVDADLGSAYNNRAVEARHTWYVRFIQACFVWTGINDDPLLAQTYSIFADSNNACMLPDGANISALSREHFCRHPDVIFSDVFKIATLVHPLAAHRGIALKVSEGRPGVYIRYCDVPTPPRLVCSVCDGVAWGDIVFAETGEDENASLECYCNKCSHLRSVCGEHTTHAIYRLMSPITAREAVKWEDIPDALCDDIHDAITRGVRFVDPTGEGQHHVILGDEFIVMSTLSYVLDVAEADACIMPGQKIILTDAR